VNGTDNDEDFKPKIMSYEIFKRGLLQLETSYFEFQKLKIFHLKKKFGGKGSQNPFSKNA
jgi:hypothetical protein